MSINQINKLSDLADYVVPENIQTSSPQIYGLIKAFLTNMQEVQESHNSKFLDTIDFDRIKNTDFKKIYIDTYLAMFNLTDIDNIDSLGDLVNISKDITSIKGSQYLYNLLIRLLFFLDESIDTQYNEILKKYNESTNEQEKILLKEQLDTLKKVGLETGYIEYEEENDNNGDVIPFKYTIRSNIKESLFEKYIKKLAHPAGWHIDFIQVIRLIVNENLNTYLRFNLTVTKKIPRPKVGEGYKSGNTDNRFTKGYDVIELGDASQFDYFNQLVQHQNNLFIKDSKVFYNDGGINVAPPYIVLDTDTMITNGIYLDLVAGYKGLVAGSNKLVSGNINNQFPLNTTAFKYIDINLYTGTNAIYKTLESVNKPIYVGTKNNILSDGTTIGSNYVKENQYNQVFDLIANHDYKIEVGNNKVCSGGGAVAGSNDSFYSNQIVNDI